jgi:hypothetical protein
MAQYKYNSRGIVRAGITVLLAHFAHRVTFLVLQHKPVPYSVAGIR